jgi:iron complex outermembrane recepter protein
MKPTHSLACVPAICFLLVVYPLVAQSNRDEPATAISFTDSGGISSASARISGSVRDQSGAVIPGARVEMTNRNTGFKSTMTTDRLGRFSFETLASGNYSLQTSAPGFDTRILPEIVLGETPAPQLTISLYVASTRTSIEVKESLPASASETLLEPGFSHQAQAYNAAELLAGTPGVSLRQNGALGSILALHGLADERTRLVVDGMTVSYACPNHMNPPASYLASSHAARMTVMPGITPVSLGGDSLGGTVTIETIDPQFAASDQQPQASVNSSGFYRSNGNSYGGSFTGSVAGSHFGFGYAGSVATNDNYEDGSGHKVTSTYAQAIEHAVTIAARGVNNFVALRAGLHHVPYEGFPSAQMDMVRDYAESLNLHYRRALEHGSFDARVYWQGSWHTMDIGKDKATFPMPMFMPMNTHGRDYGYMWKADIPIAARHNIAVGNEVHRFVLDDTWPPVPGTGMYPNDFVSINHGHRTRIGWFAEINSAWNQRWTTLIGLRNDTVRMDTGEVHGYSAKFAADAGVFNAAKRSRRDTGLEATAWVRYQPATSVALEVGYAHKRRVPNLYERYAWSTGKMASGMIGWFGDGNHYVGNLDLKPEAADTLGVTVVWIDPANADWDLKLTPYFTWLHDFVDVDMLTTYRYAHATSAQLRFANHDAQISGTDLCGTRTLWRNGRLGLSRLAVLAGWQRGDRTDSSTSLYQITPAHIRFAFDEQKQGFTAGLGITVSDRKSHLDPNRFERATSGYALLDVRAGYEKGPLRIAGGADNLLNRFYALPLGGVNFDDFMASGRKSELKPLTGRGRSAYFALSAQF